MIYFSGFVADIRLRWQHRWVLAHAFESKRVSSHTTTSLSKKRTRSLNKSVPIKSLSPDTMVYHDPFTSVPSMSPEDRFKHMVSVRNRYLGPIKGTEISSWLDVEQTKDNTKMLRLGPDDLNMYRVLQESSCRHGQRRKVAARALDSLGYASGMSVFFNDQPRLTEITSKLEFAASIGDGKAADKRHKEGVTERKKQEAAAAVVKRNAKTQAAAEKFQSDIVLARQKVGLGDQDPILADHVTRLTGKLINVVAFCQLGVKLKGTVSERGTELERLLSVVD